MVSKRMKKFNVSVTIEPKPDDIKKGVVYLRGVDQVNIDFLRTDSKANKMTMVEYINTVLNQIRERKQRGKGSAA